MFINASLFSEQLFDCYLVIWYERFRRPYELLMTNSSFDLIHQLLFFPA